MGNGCNVFDHQNIEPRRLQRAQGRLAPGPGSLDIDLDIFHAVFHSLFNRILGRRLRGEGRAFARPLETLHTGTGPGYGVARHVGYRDNGVVKGRLNMNHTIGDVLFLFFLGARFSGHRYKPAFIVLTSALTKPMIDKCHLAVRTYHFFD
mgnify:CR=1 FL=1